MKKTGNKKIKNLFKILYKLKKAKQDYGSIDDDALYYKKYENTPVLISKNGGILSCNKKLLKQIKNKMIENTTFKDKILFSKYIDIFEFNKDVYHLLIHTVLDIFFSDEIMAGIITREEINDLRMSLEHSEEWIKDYINKNFEELNDEEKLFIELV